MITRFIKMKGDIVMANKRTRKVCLILLFAVIGFLAYGSSAKAYYWWVEERSEVHEYGDYTYNIREDGTLEILGYTGNEKVARIPSEINGLPVRYIWKMGEYRRPDEPSSGYKNKKTKKIIVPDGVISIAGMGYFAGCPNVEEVVLPDSVSTIYEETFDWCRKLKSIRMSKGLKEIGKAAFSGCYNLKTIQLPDGLEKIDGSAFYGCGLRKITIPDSVTKIGKDAFAECVFLTKIKLSDSISVIETGTMSHCPRLKELILPKNLKRIGVEAIIGTGIEKLTIPKNVTVIDYGALAGNRKLKKITIKSKKIKIFGKKAFHNCAPQVVIDVPNSCVKKYKRMLIKAKSVNGKMIIK